MTIIKQKLKPVWRETGAIEGGVSLLVAQTPSLLLLRRKGTRQVLEIPYTLAYLKAAELASGASRRITPIRRGF